MSDHMGEIKAKERWDYKVHLMESLADEYTDYLSRLPVDCLEDIFKSEAFVLPTRRTMHLLGKVGK
jgi:hypothetical protein